MTTFLSRIACRVRALWPWSVLRKRYVRHSYSDVYHVARKCVGRGYVRVCTRGGFVVDSRGRGLGHWRVSTKRPYTAMFLPNACLLCLARDREMFELEAALAPLRRSEP